MSRAPQAGGPVDPRAVIRPVAIATLLAALFTFFFVFPAHDPEPNELPVAVVAGAPAPPVPGLDVRPYGDEAAARQAILDREVYVAFLPGGRRLVSTAASFPVAQLAGAQGASEVIDVRPLDEDDPRGVTINLMILPLSITAILGAMLLFQLAPAVAPRPRLAALAVISVAGGLIAALIVNVAIGALPGEFLAIAGICALLVGATATAAAALIQLVGGPGVGLSFVVFLMLGNPASGAASAPELLPDPWRVGGQFLPSGAGATATRNIAYFDGVALAQPVIVLVAFLLLGAALLLVAGRRGAVAPQRLDGDTAGP